MQDVKTSLSRCLSKHIQPTVINLGEAVSVDVIRMERRIVAQ